MLRYFSLDKIGELTGKYAVHEAKLLAWLKTADLVSQKAIFNCSFY